jgi:hypothetical protein
MDAVEKQHRKNKGPMFHKHTYLLYIIVLNGPPLWSSGQSSWLQIQRPGFDSRHYQKK